MIFESYVYIYLERKEMGWHNNFCWESTIFSDEPGFQFDILVIGRNIPKFSGKHFTLKNQNVNIVKIKKKNTTNIKKHLRIFNMKMRKYRKNRPEKRTTCWEKKRSVYTPLKNVCNSSYTAVHTCWRRYRYK